MTSEQWLACDDPAEMLSWLREKGKLDERRARLFAVGCCYSIRELLQPKSVWRAVKVAERRAERKASAGEMRTARSRVHGSDPAILAARWAADEDHVDAAMGASAAARKIVDGKQANLLRCIFGDPFRPLALDASLLTETVVRLANTIYEERRFSDMPVLADALEEHGLTDAEALGHLRGPGPHARGCHVLDVILERGVTSNGQ